MTRLIRSFWRFVLSKGSFFLLPLCLTLLSPAAFADNDDENAPPRPAPRGGTDEEDVANPRYVGEKYQRPLITFLGSRGIIRRFPRGEAQRIEELIRQTIEGSRFLGIKIPTTRGSLNQHVQAMIRVISKRAMGIAKMRAEWDSSFRGYNITMDMLKGIENLSFMYWLDFRRFQPMASDPKQFDIDIMMTVLRLEVFDCSGATKSRGGEYARACEGKGMGEMTGFAKPYKVFRGQSSAGGELLKSFMQEASRQATGGLFDAVKASQGNLSAVERAALQAGYLLSQQIARDPHLGFYTPVVNVSPTRVKFNLGLKEGLKINRGFDVYVRTTKGSLIYRGHVRVRSVGDNREKMVGNERVRVDPKAPLFSEAEQLIEAGSGGIMKGMLMYERPYRAWSLTFGLGLLGTGSSNSNLAPFPEGIGAAVPFPVIQGSLMAPSLQFGGLYDLSSTFNINEVYLSAVIDVGFAFAGVGENSTFAIPFTLHVGLIKRFHLRRFAFIAGARLGIGGFATGLNFFSTLGGEIILGVEFMISPEWTIFLHTGMRAHWVGWESDTSFWGGYVAPNAMIGFSYAAF